MMTLDTLPRSGVLLITIHFKGYKNHYANETRRILGGFDKYPGIINDAKRYGLKAEVMPLNYWLARTIVEKVTRATGGMYKFGFSKLTANDFKIIHKVLMNYKSRYDWWEDVDILLGNRVDGY